MTKGWGAIEYQPGTGERLPVPGTHADTTCGYWPSDTGLVKGANINAYGSINLTWLPKPALTMLDIKYYAHISAANKTNLNQTYVFLPLGGERVQE